jgi:osmotically-inducible protein OsmY
MNKLLEPEIFLREVLVMTPVGVSDEELKKEIVDHLYWSNKADVSDVNVQVDDKEVILSGTVDSLRMKRDIEDLTFDISGVYAIQNDLEVVPDLEEEPLDDGEIKTRVEDVLAWDSDIDLSRIEVRVTGGIVTLKGNVDENWKVMYTLSKAEELEGVVDVLNELSVVPDDDIEDEAIARDLMSAFERNFSIDPDPIELRVEDGTVYLEGSVQNNHEETEVYNTAIQTPGVEEVINNMVVQSDSSGTL